MSGNKVLGLSGNEAVAYAIKQANVDVIAAYPITPQTIIVERLSEYVNNGELNAAFIPVESEHSAISTCVGASLTGARVFTATSSQGLALMHEILHIAASLRAPIVMAIANRALSAPINIHCDHSDIMNARDTGWIIMFAENVQEAYDLVLQAFKIAESHEVLLPVAVNLDGFILSHSLEGVNVLDDDEVSKFLPKRQPIYPVDFEKPVTYGPLALPDYFFEIKRQQAEAMEGAKPVIERVGIEYGKLSNREYKPIKAFGMEDAEVAVVALGSSVGTLRAVARRFRKKGRKIGVLGLTLFRPFPREELIKYLEGVKVLIILDRAISYGSSGGPLYLEIAGVLYRSGLRPIVLNVIYGLGGRDLRPSDVEAIYEEGFKCAERGRAERELLWVGVRE
ncbi:MAG: pyruvate ferredoxin oxidoreductase [Thermofilum sp. ex4484_15]|nr:MAG: pyruvate ferredoxin oxidoreductase [Thermofilum sp. ex4484_15]